MHMSSQVVGLFDTLAAAQDALRALRGRGISNAELRVVASPGRSVADVTVVDSTAAPGESTAPPPVAAEALLLARVNHSELAPVVDLLRRHHAVDIDDRADEFLVEGWSLYDEGARSTDAQ